jgi:hypothetical protein
MLTHLSEALKWRVVYLSMEGYSANQIAKVLYISLSSVRRTLEVYQKWQRVTEPSQGGGRRRIFDRDNLTVWKNTPNFVLKKYLLTPFHSYLVNLLAKRPIGISMSSWIKWRNSRTNASPYPQCVVHYGAAISPTRRYGFNVDLGFNF